MKNSYAGLLAFILLCPLFKLSAQSIQTKNSASVYNKIVFSRQESQSDWDLWTMDIDGNNQTRIHNSTSNDGDPHFRYDGGKIVFSRFTQAMPPTGDIYLIDPDGSNPTNLSSDTQSELSRPKWSWDGTKIVYCTSVGIDDKDIYTMNADGTNKTALITGSNNDEWPSYSPNGQYIVFQRYIGSIQNQKTKICRYKISDGSITDLTDGNNLDEMPIYSPDGNNILFKRGTTNAEIYQLRLDNSTLTNLTNNSIVDDAPMYSYDGTKIVWMQSSTGMNTGEIWIMNSDGTGKTQLTSNSVADFNPSFSPFSSVTGPEINIKGNDQDIQSGDTSPSTSDYTDFGSALVDGGTVTRTFTIENKGNQSLTLSGNPIVQITGTNSSDFSVVTNPAATIIANGSTTFQIKFDPGSSGTKNATVSISNNDSNENPYTFEIQGSGAVPAQPVYNKIAFTRSQSSSDWDIWIMDRNGSNEQKITENSYRDTNPHFNPQGTRIVFARLFSQQPMQSDIIAIDPDGKNETNLTNISTLTQPALSPKYSWDGQYITFDVTAGIGNGDIWIMNSDGTGHRAILNSTSGDDSSPAFSPDGQWIVFQRLITTQPEPKCKICKVKISDGTVTDLTDGNHNDETPVFSADGNYILFKRGYTEWDLIRMPSNHNPSDNSTLVNMTNQPTTPDGTANYSYEGDKIVYYTAVMAPETAEIYIMNADGSNNTRITNNSVADWDPTFSPAQQTGPEINLKGNDQNIQNGDTTPSSTDYTDFGSTSVDGGSVTRTFTIENSGNQNLTLGGNPIVQITGTNTSDFTLVLNPLSTITAGGSTTFQIKFDPGSSGIRNATVSISNNDSDENPYTFSIQGTGIAAVTAVYDKIAFTRQQSTSDWDIWIMDSDGSNQRCVLNSDDKDMNPHFSPDGKYIVFSRSSGSAPNLINDAYIMNSDGTNVRNLTDDISDGCVGPKFSWDGSKIAFFRNKQGTGNVLCTMNTDGTNKQYVNDQTGSPVLGDSPFFTPDGKWLVFQRVDPDKLEGAVYKVPVTGGNVIQLTNATDFDELPRVSADGQFVVSKYDPLRNGISDIAKFSINQTPQTSAVTNISNTPSDWEDAPMYSYEGNKIAFMATSGGTYNSMEIYVMNADGTNRTRLTNNSQQDFDPTFSPASQVVLPTAPIAIAATSITQSSFTANWNVVTGVTGYSLDVSTDNNFTSFLNGYNSKEVGNVTSFSIAANLSANTTYYYRVRSYNAVGTSGNSNTVTLTTLPNIPNVPIATVATSIAQTSFTANWNAVSSATGYYLDVATDNNFTNLVNGYNNKDVGNVISIIVGTNLSAKTTYYYRIRSYNSGGISGNSNTVTLTTLPNIPSVPIATAATSITQTSFTANWNAVDDASGYFLDISTDNNFTDFVTGYNNKDVGNVTSIIVGTNLLAKTTYYYRIRSYNSGGTSGYSNTITSTTLSNMPNIPIATTATSITQTSFTANWNAVDDASGYFLDISTNNNFTDFVTGYNNKDVGNVTSIIVGTNLLAKTAYYYRIRSYNSGGTSGNSNTITLTTLPNIPSVPTATAATSISQTSFTANWNSVTEVTGYYFDLSTDENFTNFVTGYNNKDVGNVTSFIIEKNLSAKTTYYYRIRSYNPGGTSVNSNTIKLITLPNIPSVPAAMAATSIIQTSFTANWNSVTEVTGYYFDLSTDNNFTNFVTGYNNKDVGNVTSFIVEKNLSAKTTYYYRIRSYNSGGISGNSNTITLATLPNIPAAPTATAATLVTQKSFVANWNEVTGAEGYFMDVASDAEFTNCIDGFKNKDVSKVTSYSVNGLIPNQSYYYRIRAYNAGGTSSASNTVVVMLVGVYEYGKGIPTEFKLEQNFPNPFNPETTIYYQIPVACHVSLKVYTLLGREILSLVDEFKSPGFYQIALSSNSVEYLNSGVYFYRLDAGSFSSTRKFILLK